MISPPLFDLKSILKTIFYKGLTTVSGQAPTVVNPINRADPGNMNELSAMKCSVEKKARILDHRQFRTPTADALNDAAAVKQCRRRAPKIGKQRNLWISMNRFNGTRNLITIFETTIVCFHEL